jgi:hypothetical protein
MTYTDQEVIEFQFIKLSLFETSICIRSFTLTFILNYLPFEMNSSYPVYKAINRELGSTLEVLNYDFEKRFATNNILLNLKQL